jgi:16S rRNA G966 N2-methylase RsmD
MDLKKLGQDFQAVYIDPPFLLPDEEPSPEKITLQQFVKTSLHHCLFKRIESLLIYGILSLGKP